MKNILFNKTQNTASQFVRYIFVGGFAAALDTGCLFFLHSYLGANYLIAAAAGFTLGLIFNYLVSIAWVFESSGKIKEEFALFSIIGAGGLAWTELILWTVVNFAQAPLMVGKIVSLVLVLFWNFGMRKRFVFVAT